MIGRTAGNMGLSWLFCRRCGEVKLHAKFGTCSHCGQLYVAEAPSNLVPFNPLERQKQIDARNFKINAARKQKRLSIA